LSNYPSTAECLPTYVQQKNIDLVVRHGIFTEAELRARYAIHLESYNKIVAIEAKTMLDMAVHQILPAAIHYTKDLCDALNAKKSCGLSCRTESILVKELSTYTDALYDAVDAMRSALANIPQDKVEAANYNHDTIVPGMQAMRSAADMLESLTDKSYWPYPTYSDLLFY
jgi:glutamine synthetase